MKIGIRGLSLAAALSVTMGNGSANAYVLLADHNLGTGCLNAAGFDSSTDRVWTKACHGAFRSYDRSGNLLSTVTDANLSDDSDFTFANEAVTIGGNTVAAGSILYGNGDDSRGPRLSGIDKLTGAEISSMAVPTGTSPPIFFSGSMVGAAYSAQRDTFFLLSWNSDRIMEFDSATGTQVGNISINPIGSPPYDVFYGDVEVDDATGNLLIVSDTSNFLRELTPTGSFVQDIDIGVLGISGISGLGLDQFRGELWLSSTNGHLYQLGGFQALPPSEAPAPAALALFGLGLLGIGAMRRLKAA